MTTLIPSMSSPLLERANELGRLQSIWESYAKDDPLWAILSAPGKTGGKWDLEEFFQTGLFEIAQLFQILSSNDIEFEQDSALDFGCGVGRLTQALARQFGSVCGVDISPTMIENAGKLNRHQENCSYCLNASLDLRLFEDNRFSLIYSSIVLQHMPPDMARGYLAEFGRILKPGGLLVFQLPSRFQIEEGLPANAWVCAISAPEQKLSWPPSAQVTIAVSVQNISPVPWEYEARLPIMLGNHWADETGRMIRQDDGRAMLPNAMAPGEKVDLSLNIKIPPTPGRYTLELDLVQESVAWFKEKGAQTLQLPVEVLGASPARNAASDQASRPGLTKTSLPSEDPIRPAVNSPDTKTSPDEAFEGFSMHCIPRAEVVAFLEQHGMRLEFIQPSAKGGPGYQSYLYFARATRPAHT